MHSRTMWKFGIGFAIGFWVCSSGPSVSGKIPVLLKGKPLPDRPARVFKGHKDIVFGVAFSPDSQTVASASWDGTVRLWRLERGKVTGRIRAPKSRFNCVAFSPDGKTLATGNSDNIAQLWDISTTKLRIELKGHTRSVGSVAFSPDGKTLATAGSDETVKLWDVETGDCKATHNHGVSVAFFPDGKTLASRRDDTVIL